VAQGAFIMIAFVLVVMNTVADVTYALLDPRVSVGARR
jgi:peptide/nickel transport system permease protein